MTDLQPAIVPGVPGLEYEVTWGRKTMRSATFIGRVYERPGGGGMQLWACDHKHPDQASAQDCALGQALVLAKRGLDAYRGTEDVQALRDALASAFPGMTITFADPE
jgi:hypothetical protein